MRRLRMYAIYNFITCANFIKCEILLWNMWRIGTNFSRGVKNWYQFFTVWICEMWNLRFYRALSVKLIRLQRSGIDTIKYHTWPRIPMGKWQTHRRHLNREPRGQPFPSRWPQSTYKQTRTKHSKHKTEHKHKRSTKEVPPWNGQ